MAIKYRVRASVIDIRSDVPRSSDAFLVDSNVWFWITFAGAGLSKTNQELIYPSYIKRARKEKSHLFRCGLSMPELTHTIEKTKFEIFQKAHPEIQYLKEYRHNYMDERGSVATDASNAWQIVKSIAKPLRVVVDDSITDAALARISDQFLDGYDLLLVEAMMRANVLQVLSDDGDFASVPGIRLFTANHRVVNEANNQGKLVKR